MKARERLGWWTRAAGAVVAVVVARVGCGQVAPEFPSVAQPSWVHRNLSAAGVRPRAAEALAAWEAYLDTSDQQTREIVDAWIAFAKQHPSGRLVSIGVEERRQRREREERGRTVQLAARAALFARLAEAAAPEDRAVVEQYARFNQLELEVDALRGGNIGMAGASLPQDIGLFLLRSRNTDPETARRGIALANAAIEARIASYRAARKAMQAEEMARSERADQLGYAGLDEASAAMSVVRRNGERRAAAQAAGQPAPAPERFDSEAFHALIRGNRAAMGRDSAPFRQIVRAQLAAYQEVLPSLTEQQKRSLRKNWLPSVVGAMEPPEGLPQLGILYWHRVGPWVSEFVRVASLDDAQREQVRRIGRAWIADDDAILDAAFASWAQEGTPKDPRPERTARARQALQEFAKIPGLEPLGETPARMPTGALADPDPRDDEAFEMLGRVGASPEGSSPEEADRTRGVPIGYRADAQDRFATLLRLDEGQRAILAAVLVDARERWNREVEPLVAKARPEIRSQPGSNDPQIAMRNLEQDLRERVAADAAWDAAATVDAATFDALEAALGDRCDHAALRLLRAVREAQRPIERAGWRDPTSDIASLLLDAPLSAEGRAKATAAVLPAAQAWLQARTAARTALPKRLQEELESRREQAKGPPPPTAPEPAAPTALQRYDTALESVAQSERAMVQLAAASLEGQDRLRWDLVTRHAREGSQYTDIRPLWIARDAALACVEAQARPALAEQLDALLRPFAEGVLARGDAIVEARGDRWTSRDMDATMVGNACIWEAIRRGEILGARMELLIPQACWPPNESGRGWSTLRGMLAGSDAPKEAAK